MPGGQTNHLALGSHRGRVALAATVAGSSMASLDATWFALASLLCGAAPNIGVVVAARFLQGAQRRPPALAGLIMAVGLSPRTPMAIPARRFHCAIDGPPFREPTGPFPAGRERNEGGRLSPG